MYPANVTRSSGTSTTSEYKTSDIQVEYLGQGLIPDQEQVRVLEATGDNKGHVPLMLVLLTLSRSIIIISRILRYWMENELVIDSN